MAHPPILQSSSHPPIILPCITGLYGSSIDGSVSNKRYREVGYGSYPVEPFFRGAEGPVFWGPEEPFFWGAEEGFFWCAEEKFF